MPFVFLKSSPILMLVLCATLWSLGGLFIKQVDLHPLTVAGFRSFFALFVLLPLVRPLWPQWKDFNFITAVITYAGTVICFSVATKWTTAANAILLQSTAPLFVAPLAFVYLREPIKKADLWCGLGILLGLYFFFREGLNSSFNQGDLFGLIAGVFFAFFIVSTRKAGEKTALSSVLWGNVATVLLALPTLYPRHPHDSILNIFAVDTAGTKELDTSFFAHFPNNQEWIYLMILGFVQLGFPYWLYSKAIAQVRALKANLILLIEPILNPLWVFLFLNETPTRDTLVGGSLVLTSVLVRLLRKPSK